MPSNNRLWQNFRLGRHHRFHPLGEFRLMECGAEYFPALERAIALAKNSICIEVYIFANDLIGQQISRALCAAAQRGVSVKVIVDWIGSGKLAFETEWQEAGVEFHYYNPKIFGPFGLSRTHRKITVIDRTYAFVGGINICDDWQDISGKKLQNPRWDFAAEISDELVLEVQIAFDWQWRRTAIQKLSAKGIRQRFNDLNFPWAEWVTAKSDKALVGPVGAFVARDNLHYRRAIEKLYLKAIGAASKEIYLVNPYFLPSRKLRLALILAAKRGVKVNLLIGRGQFKWLDAAVSALYGVLLKSGIQVYEYTYEQLHAKLMVTDGHWLTLGSSNCDPLSFFVNHEANLIVIDSEQANQLIEKIRATIILRARAVEMLDYQHRPLYKKIIQWLAYIVSRIMTRVLIYGVYDHSKKQP